MSPVVLKFLEMKLICWTRSSLLSALGFRFQERMVEGSANRNRRYLPGVLWFTAVSPDSSLEYWINTLAKWNPGFESSFCPFLAVRLCINYLHHLEVLLDDEKSMYSIKPYILDAYYFQPIEAKGNEIETRCWNDRYHYHFKRRPLCRRKAFCLKAFWEGLDSSWKNPTLRVIRKLLFTWCCSNLSIFKDEQMRPILYIYIWGYENEIINKKGASFSKPFCPSLFWWVQT